MKKKTGLGGIFRAPGQKNPALCRLFGNRQSCIDVQRHIAHTSLVKRKLAYFLEMVVTLASRMHPEYTWMGLALPIQTLLNSLKRLHLLTMALQSSMHSTRSRAPPPRSRVARSPRRSPAPPRAARAPAIYDHRIC